MARKSKKEEVQEITADEEDIIDAEADESEEDSDEYLEVPEIDEINMMSEKELDELNAQLPEGGLDNWDKLKLKAKRQAMVEALYEEDDDTEVEAEADEPEEMDELAEELEAPKTKKTKGSKKESKPAKPAKPARAEKEEKPAKAVKTEEPVKAEKTKKAKKNKADSGDLIDDTAHKIENLTEDQAYEEVRVLSEDIDYNYFRLGGVLSVIDAKQYFGEYSSFREIVESEFGIKYRKARYLVDIYNNILSSGVPWSKLQHIGWTKIREIAHLIDEDNVDEWIEKCQNMNTDTLKAEVKALEQDGTEDTSSKKKVDSTTTMTFKLHADQKDNVDAAIEKCMEALGTEVRSQALEHICLDYLSGDTKKGTKPMSTKQFLQKFLKDAKNDQEEAFNLLTSTPEFKELFPEIKFDEAEEEVEDEEDDAEEEVEDEEDDAEEEVEDEEDDEEETDETEEDEEEDDED